MKIIFCFARCFLASLCFATAVSAAPAAPYSPTPEMLAFFNAELRDLLVVQLSKANTPYPEVNARYKEGCEIIRKEFGKTLAAELQSAYHPAGKRVLGYAGLAADGSTSQISLVIPALKNRFAELKAKGDPQFRETFKLEVIIVVMHELEHLRYLLRFATVKEFNVEEETRAWFETCKYTIAPLVDKYGLPVDEEIQSVYLAWKITGQNPSDPDWKEVIQNLYSHVRKPH